MLAILVGVVLAGPPASQPVSAAPATQAPKTTVIRGKAENAKLSAIVLTPDDGVVYVIELPWWPDDQLGREVEVTGVVEVTDQFKARVDENGLVSQGTGGGDTLIRQATIKVLEPRPKSP